MIITTLWYAEQQTLTYPNVNHVPANFVFECEHNNTHFEDIVYGDTVYGWDLMCDNCDSNVTGERIDWDALDAYIAKRRADNPKYI